MEKTLHVLVKSLRKDEIRHFRLLQERYEIAGDRKDMQLFDYLLKHNTIDDDKIHAKLYPRENKNSFYRLCNRLKKQIEKSLLFQHYGHSQKQQAFGFYQLYLHFYEIQQIDLAYKYLIKAEAKAIENHVYELLEMIYSAFILLSNEESINPSEHIKNRQAARDKKHEIQQLDDVLSLLRYRIRVSQNFSGKQNEISSLTDKTIKEVLGKRNATEDPFIYFKIYETVSRILLSTNDFTRLESYLISSFEKSAHMKWFTRDNHEVKLQMLTYLINTSFKNKKYKQALDYCNQLKIAMLEFNSVLRDKFLFYYYNGLVNTYSVLDKHKAILIISEALEIKKLVSEPMNALFLHLQLALQLFDTREFKPAAKQLQKVYMNNSFAKLDSGFQLKIKVFDMLLRSSLNDFENLSRLIIQSKKDFKDELNSSNFMYENNVMEILKLVNSNKSKSKQRALEQAKELYQNIQASTELDNQLVDYKTWLKETFRIVK